MGETRGTCVRIARSPLTLTRGRGPSVDKQAKAKLERCVSLAKGAEILDCGYGPHKATICARVRFDGAESIVTWQNLPGRLFGPMAGDQHIGEAWAAKRR